MTELNDDEILRRAKEIKSRRRKERALCRDRRLYFQEYKKRPEVRARRREKYWCKHHPVQLVPPSRKEKKCWFEDQDDRIRAAEADAGVNL